MYATVRPIVMLAVATVFIASSGAAQTDPVEGSTDPRSLHGPPDPRSLHGPPDPKTDPLDSVRPPGEETQILSFPRDVGLDIWRLFTTGETYRILGAGLAGSVAARSYDEDVRNSIFGSSSPDHEDVRPRHGPTPADVLGGASVQFGAAFAAYGIGSAVGKSNVASLGRDLARAQLLSGSFTHLVKFTVRRTRPDGYNHNSFPSGHSSSTFASATVLNQHYGWKAGIPAFGVASYVAVARVADDKHYLSDIIFGAAVGIVGGRTVTFDRGETRLEVAPMAVAGGAGVQVSVFRMSAGSTAERAN